MTTLPRHALNDGSDLPAVGFGTYPLKGEDGIEAMVSALGAGYRLLDTAVNYENEQEVGEAIRRSGVDRGELTVQTKIPGRDHAFHRAVASVEGSLERLGLEQVDIAVIHWPNPSVGLYVEAWRALVECRDRGLVRSIGVSNFSEHHLRDIVDDSGVVPVVNQVELHPWFPQAQLRAVHDELGIVTEAWSPLAKQAALLDEPALTAPAEQYGVTPAQVALRWSVQLGVVPLPKSSNPQRQRENLELGGFELTEQQMRDIAALGRSDGRRFDGDPDVHEEM